MARVYFPASLRQHVGGLAELEVDAGNYRALLRELDARFPGFEALVDGRMTLSVDGELISDPLCESIEADSEIHFIPQISGGAG